MRAYRHFRFADRPDVADIQAEGRKGSVGRLRRGEAGCHNDRGYAAGAAKAATRRYLKRVDRAIDLQFEARAEA